MLPEYQPMSNCLHINTVYNSELCMWVPDIQFVYLTPCVVNTTHFCWALMYSEHQNTVFWNQTLQRYNVTTSAAWSTTTTFHKAWPYCCCMRKKDIIIKHVYFIVTQAFLTRQFDFHNIHQRTSGRLEIPVCMCCKTCKTWAKPHVWLISTRHVGFRY